MTDSVQKAIERVLELDEKATPGPWRSRILGGSGEHDFLTEEKLNIYKATDLEMLAEYRTLCPRLARALKIAMEALSDPRYGIWLAENFKSEDCRQNKAFSQIAKVFE
jgi:hypothetical protein